LKIELLGLEFTAEHFYLQKESIVERITFNNRTFYSKFELQKGEITPDQLQEHFNHKVTLALPLVNNNLIDYIVIEYQQEDWQIFYSLVRHLLKSLEINTFKAYRNDNKNLFQLFIPRKRTTLEIAYDQVENIKYLLELKHKKSYKIYPNKNLPKNFNIITLPTQNT